MMYDLNPKNLHINELYFCNKKKKKKITKVRFFPKNLAQLVFYPKAP